MPPTQQKRKHQNTKTKQKTQNVFEDLETSWKDLFSAISGETSLKSYGVPLLNLATHPAKKKPLKTLNQKKKKQAQNVLEDLETSRKELASAGHGEGKHHRHLSGPLDSTLPPTRQKRKRLKTQTKQKKNQNVREDLETSRKEFDSEGPGETLTSLWASQLNLATHLAKKRKKRNQAMAEVWQKSSHPHCTPC